MSVHRALVVHTRMPAFDRDSGSQDVDNTIRFLLDAGWDVTFLAREEEGVAEERHADRLRQMGVATYAGFGWADRVLRSGNFDLAVIAFWELAERIIPIVRDHSPRTRIVVNSMDVHFLRNARGSFGRRSNLEATYGTEASRELNTYNAADAVIAVSEKERTLLGDFLGHERVFTLPLAEDVPRSTVPIADRRGMFFVGNFRHVPNRQAAEFLCNEVVPLLDRELLDEHPVSIIGNWLTEAKLPIDDSVPGVNLVGWVPSMRPYLHRSRAALVPLLHGAGVKRKVIQALMARTPVVTTPVGAEGLDLVQGEHALIAADAADMAAGITRLLSDDALWERLTSAGADHVDARHSLELVESRFTEIIDRVLELPRDADGAGASSPTEDRTTAAEVRRRIQSIAPPGAVVLVASGGDDALVDLGSQACWHFPQGRDGGWAGFDPVDGRAAITHLEAQRAAGASWFVLPRTQFSWRHRFPELRDHLAERYRRVHDDEHLLMYDLAEPGTSTELEPTPAASVTVIGTYPASRTGPSPALMRELRASETLEVLQHWHSDAESTFPSLPDDTDADFTVLIRDDAVVPSGFLDDLVATQVTLDVDRLQPAHSSGPEAGPPATERHLGVVGREVADLTPLPVVSVRRGAGLTGPTTIADQVTIGLRSPLKAESDAFDPSTRRVWTTDGHARPVAFERTEPERTPRISVLIATYERTDLLADCLRSFARQTLPRDDFEVVLVDDGSEDSALPAMLAEFGDDLHLVAVRIAHAGRSAAKNHAVLLARAPVVLFFDDDDRAAPDYLERHLLAHDERPGEADAVLGHTDWAPELELSPLMRYITDVDRLMFAYERLGPGQQLDWRGFWEGRISCKRSLLVHHGLHDQRLAYSIDVEMGWRLASRGLRVTYDPSATSEMVRPLDLDGFCARTQAKGRAHAVVASLHPGTDIAKRLLPDDSAQVWSRGRLTEPALRRKAAALEPAAADDPSVLDELHKTYRSLFRLMHAKGVADATGAASEVSTPAVTVEPFPNTDPAFVSDGSPEDAPAEPLLSISIPVWSRTPELAEMARRTVDRIWEVARVPTEVVVVDNGSPHEVPLAAKVYRYDQNRGVATGWNTGIRLSTADTFVVLNSDCTVEPGWDEALYEAANDGRRVAFPYTDHCDGRGFSWPDQGGTSGWCFMMTKAVYEEVGVFDEWFNPAFCEDTDYWHRAWELGIELSPVPAARVIHARRTSSQARSDLLLQAHRYKYGWKHDVDPDRAPPYYNRDAADYVGTVRLDQDAGR